jgi:hypothetical protein
MNQFIVDIDQEFDLGYEYPIPIQYDTHELFDENNITFDQTYEEDVQDTNNEISPNISAFSIPHVIEPSKIQLPLRFQLHLSVLNDDCANIRSYHQLIHNALIRYGYYRHEDYKLLYTNSIDRFDRIQLDKNAIETTHGKIHLSIPSISSCNNIMTYLGDHFDVTGNTATILQTHHPQISTLAQNTSFRPTTKPYDFTSTSILLRSASDTTEPSIIDIVKTAHTNNP